jgi:hypothetical protein
MKNILNKKQQKTKTNTLHLANALIKELEDSRQLTREEKYQLSCNIREIINTVIYEGTKICCSTTRNIKKLVKECKIFLTKSALNVLKNISIKSNKGVQK